MKMVTTLGDRMSEPFIGQLISICLMNQKEYNKREI